MTQLKIILEAWPRPLVLSRGKMCWLTFDVYISVRSLRFHVIRSALPQGQLHVILLITDNLECTPGTCQRPQGLILIVTQEIAQAQSQEAIFIGGLMLIFQNLTVSQTNSSSINHTVIIEPALDVSSQL